MKYTEHTNDLGQSKRIESNYIAILGGHLVFEERAFFSADVVKKSGDPINYGGLLIHTLTRDDLIDLRSCIDLALNSFPKIKNANNKLMNILAEINTYLGELNRRNIERESRTDISAIVILCRELSKMVFLNIKNELKAEFVDDGFSDVLKKLRDCIAHGDLVHDDIDFITYTEILNTFFTKETDSFACALVYETLKRFMEHFKLSDVERSLVCEIESSIAQNDVQRQARLTL